MRWVGTLMVAVCCSGAVAAGATAATLHVKVTPGQIHRGKAFHILITGSYRSSELKGKAYLLAFDQFNDTSACNRDASKEAKKASAKQGRFTHMAAGASPFGWDFKFTAGSAGPRRVCAYLFPKKTTTGAGNALTRATATFRVKR